MYYVEYPFEVNESEDLDVVSEKTMRFGSYDGDLEATKEELKITLERHGRQWARLYETPIRSVSLGSGMLVATFASASGWTDV